MKKTRVIIMGSTGSIGTSALDVIRQDRERFEVIGLAVNGNLGVLREQIAEFSPACVAVGDAAKAGILSSELSGMKTNVLVGEEGVLELAGMESDVVVMGIVGLAALRPIMHCLGRTRRLALANKEAVLAAGELLMDRVRASGTDLFPVDSEAWGVYRLLRDVPRESIRKVYITASGGPFFFAEKTVMEKAGIREVLAHPVWDMGSRITVDSASFMNKGFEIIEIHRLFDIPLESLDVLVHPQGAVHALLATRDGGMAAMMFSADMRIPIAYSLYHPDMPVCVPFLDLAALGRCEFHAPDNERFPSMGLAYETARRGGNLPAVLTAADEAAVGLFLEGKIRFLDIYELVREAVHAAPFTGLSDIEDVFYWDAWARHTVYGMVAGAPTKPDLA